MATDLTGLQVRNTYNSLLKIGDNTSLTGIAKRISDGLGNDSPLFISTSQISIGVAPATGYDLTVNSGIRTGSIDILGAATTTSLQFTGGGGTQGTMSWNTDEETVDLIQNGATLQLGQETHVHVKNQSGATINDGTPVYVTGTLGASGRLTVAPMIADGSIPAKYFLGVTTEDIPDGEDGKVTTFGKIRGLDTTAYTEGQTLYVSSTTAGFWQTTPPAAPALDLEVAIVINVSANNGTLFVRSTNGQYLGMLHDVYLNSVSNNQLLVYNATNSRWENQGIASIGSINLDTVTDNGNTTTNSISVGDINAGNVTLTGYLRGAANFVIDPAAHGDETGVVQILGDLRVDGTTTTINSTTVTIDDKNIVLASGSATAADANGAGITIDGAGASMTYNSTSDRFVFDKHVQAEKIIAQSNSSSITLDPTLQTSNYALTIGVTDDGIKFQHNSNSRGFVFDRNGTELLNIASNGSSTFFGNVTAPTFIGNLDGSADQVDGLDATDFTLQYVTDNDATTTNEVTIDNNFYIANTNTASKALYVMRTTATSQSLRIHVNDDSAVFTSIQDENTGSFGSFVFNMDSGATDPTFDVRYGSSTVARFRANEDSFVGTSGNFGVGTDTPSEKLEVDGNVKATSFIGDGSSITNVDAETLDTLNSTQFVRSDVDDIKTGYILFDSEGTADVNTNYPSSPLIFRTSGWDTNGNSARDVDWYIRAESTSSVYPEGDLVFYEESPSFGHYKMILRGRGSGSGYLDVVAADFYGNVNVNQTVDSTGGNLTVAGNAEINDKLTIIGTTNNLLIDETADGTWHIYDTFQDNGIKIYSGSGGMEFQYQGSTEMTIDAGGVTFNGTVDLSDANLNIGSADIVFGIDATDTGARGLVWNFDADGDTIASNIGYIRAGGTLVGEVLQFNMNAEGTITGSGTVYQFMNGGTDIVTIGADGSVTADSFIGDGSGLTNVDAETLDGLNSTQFLRSDADDTATGMITINSTGGGILRLQNNDTSNAQNQTLGSIVWHNQDASGTGANNAAIIEAQAYGGSGQGANLLFKTVLATAEGEDATTGMTLFGDGDLTVVGDVTAPTFIGDLNGNASTASEWETARTITLGGDLTGSVSIDGSANVTLSGQVVNDSHTHDSRYYTEEESEKIMARALGWVPAYSNTDESTVFWNEAEQAVQLYSGADSSIGMAYKAIRMKAGDKARFTVVAKSAFAASTGLYVRLYFYSGDLPDGKTHVSHNASTSSAYVQEDDFQDAGWYEDGSLGTTWQNFERTYTAPADGYVSLVILNWTGLGTGAIYVKQPDIQFEKVNQATSADDATTLDGNASSYFINTSNIGSQSVNYATGCDVVDGLHASSFLRTDTDSWTTGKLGIGTSTPQAPLHVIAANSSDDALLQEWSYTSGTQDKYSLMLKQTVTSGVVRYNFSMVNDNTAYDDVLVLDRGNVGIGNVSPNTPLHVYHATQNLVSTFESGDSDVWIDLRDNAASTYGVLIGAQGGDFRVSPNNNEVFRIKSTGEVGIKTTSPRYQLDLAIPQDAEQVDYIALGVNNGPSGGGGTALGSGLIWKANYSGYTKRSAGIVQIAESNYFQSGLAFYTNGTADATTDWVERMYLSAGGILKMNRTNGQPTIKGSTTTGAAHLIIDSASSSDAVFIQNYNSGNVLLASGGGMVGINQNAPAYPLDVTGRARITDDLFLGDVIYHDGDTNTYMQFTGDRIRFYCGGVRMLDMIESTTDKIVIPVDVSIANTADPAYALDVGGTIRASGDVIAYSDARVKENVKTIDNALDKVTQLRGVSYNKIGETEEKIGVIAQEIEKVLPQVVQEDAEGMKSVAYGNIVGVLIEAIKEQQKQIDELKARLNA